MKTQFLEETQNGNEQFSRFKSSYKLEEFKKIFLVTDNLKRIADGNEAKNKNKLRKKAVLYDCMNVFISFNMGNQVKLLKRNILFHLEKNSIKILENTITK